VVGYRTLTIRWRQTTCRSRFGWWATHTVTRHSSHHQVLPRGDIGVALLAEGGLVAQHQGRILRPRDVGGQGAQGQLLVRLQA
jgi:hypothetical protein